jgi:hypothetical protein
VAQSFIVFVNKYLFTCENAHRTASGLFKLDQDSFCISVKELIVRPWKHLLWEDFLWPQSGIEDADCRVVSVVRKAIYPPLGIWFSSGAINPPREIYAHSDGFSRAWWRCIRRYLHAFSNCAILLNGRLIPDWNYSNNPVSGNTPPKPVNRSFFDLSQYGIGEVNSLLVFDDSANATPRVISSPSLGGNAMPAVAKILFEGGTSTYILCYPSLSLKDLCSAACMATSRDQNKHILLPAKPFFVISQAETIDVSFPAKEAKLDPTVTPHDEIYLTHLHANSNPECRLFVRGGLPTSLVLVSVNSAHIAKVQAVEVGQDNDTDLGLITISTNSTTRDFGVSGSVPSEVTLLGLPFSAPRPQDPSDRFRSPPRPRPHNCLLPTQPRRGRRPR